MSRQLRIQVAGAHYHVTARANLGRQLFADSFDRLALLKLLAKTTSRFRWHCLAYCLMDNHYHLAIQTQEPNLAAAMQHLNGSYAQRLNRRCNGFGHAFQGRYGAELIEREEHLLEVVRYIPLNPVRAGRCEHPEEWPSSSYRATIGLEPSQPWLAADRLLNLFGNDRVTARLRYERFVRDGRVRGSDPGTVSVGALVRADAAR